MYSQQRAEVQLLMVDEQWVETEEVVPVHWSRLTYLRLWTKKLLPNLASKKAMTKIGSRTQPWAVEARRYPLWRGML